MSRGLRLLLPLVLGLAANAAEYQRLTFSDGTTRTGWFDERKGTLTLDDGATIAVRIDDIIRRETVVPATRKPPEIPPPVVPPTDAPQDRPRRTIGE
jgi:hypothetical protein